MRLRRAIGASTATVLLAAAGVGWQAGVAGALTTGATSTIQPVAAPWDGSLHLPRFDPRFGKLTGATLTFTVTNRATIRLENLDDRPRTSVPADPDGYEIEVAGTADLADAAVPEELLAAGFPRALSATAALGQTTLAAYDGVTDFAGPSGTTLEIPATSVRPVPITDEDALAMLVGTEDLVIPVQGLIDVLPIGGEPKALQTAAAVGIDVEVDYEYLPAAVELRAVPGQTVVAAGSPASFSLVVRNAGLVALTTIALSDDAGSDCNGGFLSALAPGEEASLQCDIAALTPAEGASSATVHVRALAQSEGPFVDADAAVSYTIARPALTVTHEADEASVPSGGAAVFTTTITNSGNVALTGGTLTDPTVPDCAGPLPALAVGASVSFVCALDGITADVLSTLTVVGDSEFGPTQAVTREASVTVRTEVPAAPAIDVENAINDLDADVAPGVALEVGDEVALAARVTNTGDERLAGVTVTDSVAGALTCPSDVLEVGASMVCTAPVTTVTDTGTVTHRTTALASGSARTVQDADDAVHTTSTPDDGGGDGGGGDGGGAAEICEATDDLLVGLTFSVDGGPEATTLDGLTALPGSVVRAHWDAFAEGAEDCQISFAQYATGSLTFDPEASQTLVDYETCIEGACRVDGGGDEPQLLGLAADGGYELRLTVADTDGPNQLDLVTGPPMADLGPGGRFYSRWLNGTLHRLLSAGTSPDA